MHPPDFSDGLKRASSGRMIFLKNTIMDGELLGKYLNNKCTDEEIEKVLHWFRDSADSTEGKDLFLTYWEQIPLDGKLTKPDLETLLNRIHHNINTMPERRISDEIREDRGMNFIRFLRNAAAILLLPIIGAGLFYMVKYYTEKKVNTTVSQSFNEVFSSVDAITTVTLPDGSKVWLNHNSSLRYPAVFADNDRNVTLEGEGYFEVAHKDKTSFTVKAGELRIVAKGTTFNVMAYPDENKIETSLIEGIVELQKDGSDKALYRMKPSDVTIYFKEEENISAETITDDRYFSWKNGKLTFSAATMDDVVKKLSRWFNVDIQLTDPGLNDLTLTATFVHETLPQVMELLARIIPIQYSISNREENGDGTFTKRKVTIKRSNSTKS
jgi:ferric-dicitrate binding protein FerR (iron transport regulator)